MSPTPAAGKSGCHGVRVEDTSAPRSTPLGLKADPQPRVGREVRVGGQILPERELRQNAGSFLIPVVPCVLPSHGSVQNPANGMNPRFRNSSASQWLYVCYTPLLKRRASSPEV